MPDLNTTLAILKGQQESLRQAKTVYDQGAEALASLQIATASQIQATVASLQGADTVGFYSSVDQLLRKERFAGKQACLDYVHAHPEATEAEATNAWATAALAATGMDGLFQDASRLGALYRSQLKAAGAIPDTTWESQRAWILARTTEEAMGL